MGRNTGVHCLKLETIGEIITYRRVKESREGKCVQNLGNFVVSCFLNNKYKTYSWRNSRSLILSR
jgi:hypothetical protein